LITNDSKVRAALAASLRSRKRTLVPTLGLDTVVQHHWS
jgi:hypothetical protein